MSCLTPECQEDVIFCRGLCQRCYERLRKHVQRKTTDWGTYIGQGLAKQASRTGASAEVRSQAQRDSAKQRSKKNPYGLTDAEWKSLVQTAREKLSNPEALSEEDRIRYNGIISLAGDSQ